MSQSMDMDFARLESGGFEWQKEVLKSQDIGVIFNKCKDKLVELFRMEGENWTDEQFNAEAEYYLVRENSVRETACPCGCGFELGYPGDKPVNAIIKWFNNVKRGLTLQTQ